MLRCLNTPEEKISSFQSTRRVISMGKAKNKLQGLPLESILMLSVQSHYQKENTDSWFTLIKTALPLPLALS